MLLSTVMKFNISISLADFFSTAIRLELSGEKMHADGIISDSRLSANFQFSQNRRGVASLLKQLLRSWQNIVELSTECLRFFVVALYRMSPHPNHLA